MAIPWLWTMASLWDDLKPSTKLLWASLALVTALLIGALLIALVDRWRKRSAECGSLDTNDQLTKFRSLYERGELSPEEFERIHDRLSRRLRKELEAPPASLAPPTESGSPPESH